MKITTPSILLPAFAYYYLLFSTYTFVNEDVRDNFPVEIEKPINTLLLNKWNPLAIDSKDAGYLNTFSHDFRPELKQKQMIVCKARHLWTTSEPYLYYFKDKEEHQVIQNSKNCRAKAEGLKTLLGMADLYLNDQWDSTTIGLHAKEKINVYKIFIYPS